VGCERFDPVSAVHQNHAADDQQRTDRDTPKLAVHAHVATGTSDPAGSSVEALIAWLQIKTAGRSVRNLNVFIETIGSYYRPPRPSTSIG
jgi:hypothetical protein